MNFLHPKNIFPIFLPIYKLNGERFISYHIKSQLTPISNTILNNVLYLNKQHFIFNKKILNCVLTVDYKMKQLITFL